ncbi:FAD-dependent oxidoreductase [Aeromicrobium sp.]
MNATSDPKRQSLWLDNVHPEPIEPVNLDRESDDIVIGAGLTGLTTAVLLARAGRQVTVLEARSVGAVATGNTTAKISLLQGTRLSDILHHHSQKQAAAYLQSNDEGKSWLERYCTEHGVGYQVRDAVSYAATAKGLASVDAEYEACVRLGLKAERVDELDVPFEHAGAVRLSNQSQFDPMEALRALASDLLSRGGQILEGVRALGLDAGDPSRVHTTCGTFLARDVVLATGVPFLDRGLYFAKVKPERSYAMAFTVADLAPTAMYLSVDAPTRSVRTAPTPDGEKLLVGGNGHVVGRAASTQAQVDDLERWAEEHYPGARPTHVWSAQDYATHDHIPFVGMLPRSHGHAYLATGYGKWGMTNAVAAALRISAGILDGHQPWATTAGHRITSPAVAMSGLLTNAKTGLAMTAGWAESYVSGRVDTHPAEGDGSIGRNGLTPAAVSTVDGVTCKLSAVCPHLGGVVSWNDAEQSWDCPLHGSRFGPDGAVLEGPATKPLARLDEGP